LRESLAGLFFGYGMNDRKMWACLKQGCSQAVWYVTFDFAQCNIRHKKCVVAAVLRLEFLADQCLALVFWHAFGRDLPKNA
jgi:hypothetical protein